MDSPILAGDLAIHEFDVNGSRHYLVNAGEVGQWDGERGAQDLQQLVRETRRFWGFLPYKKYVFLNVFRQGGGGLEVRAGATEAQRARLRAWVTSAAGR